MRYQNALMTVLCFVIITSTHAQYSERLTPISINSKETKTKFFVLDNDVNISVRNQLTYYWMKSHKLHHSQGDFEGRLLDGDFSEFYQDNQLKSKGSFDKGLKDGVWKDWYADGHLKEVARWKNGILHGTRQYFNGKGELIAQETFKHGVRHGKAYAYTNGEVTKVSKYRKGQLIEPEQKAAQEVQEQQPQIIVPDALKEESKWKKWWPFKRKSKPEEESETEAS